MNPMATSGLVIGANNTFMSLLTHPDNANPAFISALWRSTKNPATAMTASQWAYLFTRAGYSVNGAPAQRPREPVTVFRGATAAGRFGMAWSADRTVAERFARRPGAHLWTATVAPRDLLAFINNAADPEQEHVVHPSGLSDRNVGRADGQTPPPRASRAQPWDHKPHVRAAWAVLKTARLPGVPGR